MPTSPGERPAAVEDGAQEKGRRRLAVRSRHAGDLERARRLAEEDVGGDRHRRAGVLDDELRHLELERALDDERDGTGRHGLGGEVVPVGPRAGHAEEHRARRDPPRVVREVGDLDGAAGGALARGEHARQVVEVHGAPFYGGAPARLPGHRVTRTASA